MCLVPPDFSSGSCDSNGTESGGDRTKGALTIMDPIVIVDVVVVSLCPIRDSIIVVQTLTSTV